MNWFYRAVLDDLTSPPILLGAIGVVVAVPMGVIALIVGMFRKGGKTKG